MIAVVLLSGRNAARRKDFSVRPPSFFAASPFLPHGRQNIPVPLYTVPTNAMTFVRTCGAVNPAWHVPFGTQRTPTARTLPFSAATLGFARHGYSQVLQNCPCRLLKLRHHNSFAKSLKMRDTVPHTHVPSSLPSRTVRTSFYAQNVAKEPS